MFKSATPNHDVMIIDGNVDRRMRLKSATANANNCFGDVQLCADFSIATDRLKKLRDRVIVFVSEDFSKTSLNAFIEIAKNTCAGRDSAYILNISPKQASDASVLSAGLKGVDGLLLEPFSVDTLVSTTNNAAKIYYERRTERENNLVTILVSKMLRTVDILATSKATGVAPGEAVRQYKDLGSAIQHLNPRLKEFYYEQLIEQSLRAKVPAELELFLARQTLLETKIEQTAKDQALELNEGSQGSIHKSSQMSRILRGLKR